MQHLDMNSRNIAENWLMVPSVQAILQQDQQLARDSHPLQPLPITAATPCLVTVCKPGLYQGPLVSAHQNAYILSGPAYYCQIATGS